MQFSSRLLGPVIIVVLLADVFLAFFPLTVGSVSVPSPGVAVSGSWSTNLLIQPGSVLRQSLKSMATSLLFIPLPIPQTFTASNNMQAEFNTFEDTIADLMLHTSTLPAADQLHEQALVNGVVKPLLYAYSPNAMVDYVWKNHVGFNALGQPSNGTLTTFAGSTFTDYEQFKNAVQTSSEFAQGVSQVEQWGWIQQCNANTLCHGGAGGRVFVPASRYWTVFVLSLIVQVEAQTGMTQAQIINELVGQGFSPGLVYNSLTQANSLSGTYYTYFGNTGNGTLAWLPTPYGGTANALDPKIYGSSPIVLTSGIPQPLFLINNQGGIGGVTGPSTFQGVDPTFQKNAMDKVAAGCPNGCSTGENFWATVGFTGGYGQLQGGSVSRLAIPAALTQIVGQSLITAGQGYLTLGRTVASKSSDPVAVGQAFFVMASMLPKIIELGYPVTTRYDSTGHGMFDANGNPIPTCNTGCISPIGYNQFVTDLPIFQQSVQQYVKQYNIPGGQIIYGGVPLESGVLPSFGNGATPPTPYNALMTNIINGKISTSDFDSAVKAYSAGNSMPLQTLQQNAYIDQELTYLNVAGWTGVVLNKDPACNDRMCTNGATQLVGVTHYWLDNQYQLMSAALKSNDPNLKAAMASHGITDQTSLVAFWTNIYQTAADIQAGTLTQRSILAVAALMNDVILEAANDPNYAGQVNMGDLATVLSESPSQFASDSSANTSGATGTGSSPKNRALNVFDSTVFGFQGGGSYVTAGQLFLQYPFLQQYGGDLMTYLITTGVCSSSGTCPSGMAGAVLIVNGIKAWVVSKGFSASPNLNTATTTPPSTTSPSTSTPPPVVQNSAYIFQGDQVPQPQLTTDVYNPQGPCYSFSLLSLDLCGSTSNGVNEAIYTTTTPTSPPVDNSGDISNNDNVYTASVIRISQQSGSNMVGIQSMSVIPVNAKRGSGILSVLDVLPYLNVGGVLSINWLIIVLLAVGVFLTVRQREFFNVKF